MKRVVLACFLLAVLSVPVAMAGQRDRLEAYTANVVPQIAVYRSVLRRLEKLLSERPVTNVDPLVEKLYGLTDQFDRLAGRWASIAAPRGLRVRHAGMGRVFELFGEAFRINAAAIFTRHPDEILAAGPKVEARLRSAAYLQKRWAAALQGALIRAHLAVPKWLHAMAAAELS
jgi:hypothetical protein